MCDICDFLKNVCKICKILCLRAENKTCMETWSKRSDVWWAVFNNINIIFINYDIMPLISVIYIYITTWTCIACQRGMSSCRFLFFYFKKKRGLNFAIWWSLCDSCLCTSVAWVWCSYFVQWIPSFFQYVNIQSFIGPLCEV